MRLNIGGSNMENEKENKMNNDVEREHDKLKKTELKNESKKDDMDSLNNYNGIRGQNPNRKDNPHVEDSSD